MSERLYQIGGFKFAYAVAQMCPRACSHWMAQRVAIAGARNRPKARTAMLETLRHAIGGSDAELDAAYWRGIRNFGRMLADYFITAPGRHNLLDSMFGLSSGWEHVEQARAKGRGTIIVTGHIGHWELGAQWLSRCGVPLTIVTLPEPSTELSVWRTAARRIQGIKTLEVGPSREFSFVEMLGVLRRNEALAILVDRPYMNSGLKVGQFGCTTEFSMGAAMLAHYTGAAVIPAFVFAKPDWTYESVAMPEVPMDGGPLRQTMPLNTQRIADVFASLIRKYPEQWFNYVPLYTRP